MIGNNLRRYINQNRIKIITIFLAIVVLILVIRLTNLIVMQDKKQPSNTVTTNRNISSNYTQNYFVQSNEQIPETVKEENVDIIEQFFNYCNNGQAQNAYNLLSQECKEIFYPNLEYFIQNYYNSTFNKQKSYRSQSWIAKDNLYTYKIEIIDDLLSTGGVNQSTVIEDYFTIIKGKTKDELNINGYVGNKSINKSSTVNGVTITIKQENMFIDYNNYVINVKNETKKDILLDSKQNTKTVFLTDGNETTYSSFIYEVEDVALVIKSGVSSNVTIKFNKGFNKNRDIELISFTDIINDYDTYKTFSNKKEYKDRFSIEVSI